MKRDEAVMMKKANQQAAARSYNPRVKIRSFESRDLVLKRFAQKQRVFSLNWEGPFYIMKLVLSGSYRIEELDGTLLSHLWNADKLRKYYQ